MSRVVHFEVHAEEPERAIRFYKQVFEWRFTKFTGPQDYWVIETGPASEPGINGGLIRRRGAIDGTAVIAYVCTIQVAALDEALARVEAAGGTLVVPKMAIPGVGWLLYCKDSEGNVFGMMQPDPQAA
jgi:predicted enzyme related to lactoylglutathione lyase